MDRAVIAAKALRGILLIFGRDSFSYFSRLFEMCGDDAAGRCGIGIQNCSARQHEIEDRGGEVISVEGSCLEQLEDEVFDVALRNNFRRRTCKNLRWLKSAGNFSGAEILHHYVIEV